jgi:tetratricopeptide (TPR) repeat protein
MSHFGVKLACVLAALAVPTSSIAGADDRVVCDNLGSRFDIALDACNRILTQGGLDDRERASVLVSRGLAYARKADSEHAIADLDAAIALKPDLARAWWARAFFNRDTHNLLNNPEWRERIIADFTKAIELKPDYIEVYYERAGMFSAYDKDYDRAIADYSKIIELDPTYVNAYTARAIDYRNKGDYQRALADRSAVVGLTHSRDAYSDRGGAYLLLEDYDHAIADFTEARRLDPTHPSALAGLGTAYTAKGDYQHALGLYGEAIKQTPQVMWLYPARAESFLKLRAYDKALADVEHSLAVFTKDAFALNTRARIYEATGRKAEAVADFRAALALNPNLKTRDDSLAGLKRLGTEP